MTLRENRGDAKQLIKATALLFLVLAEIVDHANSGQTSQDRKGAKRRSRGYHLGTINHGLSIGCLRRNRRKSGGMTVRDTDSDALLSNLIKAPARVESGPNLSF